MANKYLESAEYLHQAKHLETPVLLIPYQDGEDPNEVLRRIRDGIING